MGVLREGAHLGVQQIVVQPVIALAGELRATVQVPLEAREVDQPDGIDEELRSPYVDEETGELDAGRWAHDAVLLALPSQILCQPDCPGLCQVCGENLKGADPEDHRHGADIDPRWAKLSELDLGG